MIKQAKLGKGYHMIRGTLEYVYPVVWVTEKEQLKLLELMPNRTKMEILDLEVENFLFKLRDWAVPVVVTTDKRLKILTSVPHLVRLRKLLDTF